MNQPWEFETDIESQKFLEDLVNEMLLLFEVNRKEAIGRINRQWKNMPFIGPMDLRYHESSDFWAKQIYFGGSDWWNNPSNSPMPILDA